MKLKATLAAFALVFSAQQAQAETVSVEKFCSQLHDFSMTIMSQRQNGVPKEILVGRLGSTMRDKVVAATVNAAYSEPIEDDADAAAYRIGDFANDVEKGCLSNLNRKTQII